MKGRASCEGAAAGRTVGADVDNTAASKDGSGRRRFAPAQPGRQHSGLAGRRDENVNDARPSARAMTQGPNACPQPAAWRARTLDEPTSARRQRGAPAIGIRWHGHGYTGDAAADGTRQALDSGPGNDTHGATSHVNTTEGAHTCATRDQTNDHRHTTTNVTGCPC